MPGSPPEVQVRALLAQHPDLPADIEALLYEILGHPEDDARTHTDLPAETGTSEVLLEMQVNDHRYILIRAPAPPEHPTLLLSPREREIVRLVAKGLPNKAIATILEISGWTVATYLRRVFAKLEVNSRAEMVARAMREGLLSDAQPSHMNNPDLFN